MSALLHVATALLAIAAPKVAAVPLQTEGQLGERERDELAQQLHQGLERLDSKVARIEPNASCIDTPCIAELARKSGAKYVVVARVKLVERDFAISLDLVDAQRGEVIASVQQICEVCGLSEAGEAMRGLAATMQTKINALEIGPAVLAIDTRPAGAIVEVDGEPVGRAPIERQLVEGEHWAAARLEGHVTQRRQVNAVAGVRESIIFDLPPVPTDTPKRGRKLEVAGWSLLGVGGAAIVTGAVLIAIDERPNRTQCSGNDVDPDGDCRLRYATLEPGAGVLAVGGALAITGLTMALVSRKRQRQRNVAAVVGPRYLGLRGRF